MPLTASAIRNAKPGATARRLFDAMQGHGRLYEGEFPTRVFACVPYRRFDPCMS